MIEVEFSGHQIRYSERDNRWLCPSLKVEGDSLSGVKAAVNSALAKLRKKNPVKVIVIGEYWSDILHQGVLDGVSKEPPDEYFWILTKEKDKVVRRKVDAYATRLDTPEARAVIAEVQKELREIFDRQGQLSRRIQELPRVKMSHLTAEETDR